MKKYLLLLVLMLTAVFLPAQMNPVDWSFSSKKIDDKNVDLIFTAEVSDGWYIYSQHLDEGGPIPTSFHLDPAPGFVTVGETKEEGDKKEGYDDLFEMKVISFRKKVVFTQKIQLTGKVDQVSGYLEFMTCNGEQCLPPTNVDFNITLR